jgi:hypothetical protein
LWGYLPRRFIEQADRWLGQTAVTPIHSGTRSYRRTHILGRVQVTISDQFAVLTDVQTTLNAVRAGFHTTLTAGDRRGQLVLLNPFHVDSLLFSLVLDVIQDGFERPVVEAFVSVAAPVFIFADVLRVTDCNCTDISVSTLFNDVFRDRVQEMGLSP